MLDPILKHFFSVLRNYLRNPQSQLDCLHAFDEFGQSNAHLAQSVSRVLHCLYDADLLEESVILDWHASPPNDPSAMDSVRKYVS